MSLRLKQAGLPLLFFVAVLAVRLPLLQALLGTWYPFEVFSGSVAVALLDGLRLDLAHLTIIEHIRGGPLFGLLLVPFYALLGASAFTLKLVPLLWHATTVALLVALGRRFVGTAAGVTLGLLFLVAPPLLSKLSVVGFASHLEATLPITVALYAFCVMTREGRLAPARFGLFGLLLGLSLFFHLQALLGGLLLLGLLVLHAPRAALKGAPLLLLGLVLGAAPMLLFDAGDLLITSYVLGGHDTREAVVPSSYVGDLPGAASYYGFRTMGKALLTSGPGPVLQFEVLGPRWGPPVAHAYGLALLLACLLALWRARRGLLALPARLVGRGDWQPATLLEAFLVLHAAAVLLLLMKSNLALNFWPAGSGMEGRRLTPCFFSLLVLAGLGLSPRRGEGRSRAAWLLLGVLLVAGALGAVASARSTPAGRLLLRGECHEWFVSRILAHHAGGDPRVIIDTVRRLDRGDPRFATLRYDVNLGYGSQLDLEVNLARSGRAGLRPDLRLWHLTSVGRAAGQDLRQARKLGAPGMLDRLEPAERAAVLHGAGLELQVLVPPRMTGVAPTLALLARSLPPDDVRLLFEGHGFAAGFTYNPFNSFHRQRLLESRDLPDVARAAFLRGFGWGHRQRYLHPPEEVPEGLDLLELVPPELQRPLLDGWLGRQFPAEAAALGQAGG